MYFGSIQQRIRVYFLNQVCSCFCKWKWVIFIFASCRQGVLCLYDKIFIIGSVPHDALEIFVGHRYICLSAALSKNIKKWEKNNLVWQDTFGENIHHNSIFYDSFSVPILVEFWDFYIYKWEMTTGLISIIYICASCLHPWPWMYVEILKFN